MQMVFKEMSTAHSRNHVLLIGSHPALLLFGNICRFFPSLKQPSSTRNFCTQHLINPNFEGTCMDCTAHGSRQRARIRRPLFHQNAFKSMLSVIKDFSVCVTCITLSTLYLFRSVCLPCFFAGVLFNLGRLLQVVMGEGNTMSLADSFVTTKRRRERRTALLELTQSHTATNIERSFLQLRLNHILKISQIISYFRGVFINSQFYFCLKFFLSSSSFLLGIFLKSGCISNHRLKMIRNIA